MATRINEHIHASTPENNFHGRLSEGILTMMDFEAQILGYTPPANEACFDQIDLIKFGYRVQEHSALFEDIFTNPTFHPAAASPNTAKIAKLCLLTAPAIMMQDLKRRSNRNFARELSRYNEAMRDVIRTNPGLSTRGLTYLLEGATLWAGVPRAYHYESAFQFELIIRGASSEFAAEQLLESPATKKAGIVFRSSSTQEDVDGTDYITTFPNGRELRLDIKHNPEQIEVSRFTGHQSPRYRIYEDNRVELYTGVGDILRGERLRLNEKEVRQRSPAFVETLEEIERKTDAKDARELPSLLAQLAVKFNNH